MPDEKRKQREEDPVDVVVRHLRVAAPELGELRIREIAVKIRAAIGGQRLYFRSNAADERERRKR